MGCSFVAPIQSALGSVASNPIVQAAAPIVAGAVLGPAAAGLIGTGTTAGAVAAGALTGSALAAGSGGNILTGAITGGLGGYAGGSLAGTTGLTSAQLSTAQSLQSAVPGLTTAQASTLAQAGLTADAAAASDLATLQAAAGNLAASPSLLQQAQSLLGNRTTGTTPQTTNQLLGALAQGAAALGGAAINANAADAATAETRRQFDIAQTNQAPYLAAGKTALGSQLDLMGLPGGTTGSPNNQLSALASSPGYQFRLQQGQRGLDAGLAARGGMGSGKAATGAAEWNQNFASNEYGNQYNRLAALAGTGQAQANNSAAQGANYAGTVGTGAVNAAAATQSGIQGAANAFSNYLNPPAAQPTFKMVNGQWVYG